MKQLPKKMNAAAGRFVFLAGAGGVFSQRNFTDRRQITSET